MNIDWKQKLKSPKFWTAVIGFVSAILVTFHFNHLAVEQVTAVITAGGVLAAYILGESMVDTARIKKELKEQSKEPQEEKDNADI